MIRVSPSGKFYTRLCYKRSYESKRSAKKAVKDTSGHTHKLRSVYQCCKCGKWHTSTMTKKQFINKVVEFKLIEFLKDDLRMSKDER